MPKNKDFAFNIEEAKKILSNLGLHADNSNSHEKVLNKLKEDSSLSANQKEYCYYLLYESWVKFFDELLIANVSIFCVRSFSFFRNKVLQLRYKKLLWNGTFCFPTEVDTLIKKFIDQRVAVDGIPFCKEIWAFFNNREDFQEFGHYQAYVSEVWESKFVEKVREVIPNYSTKTIQEWRIWNNKEFITLFLFDAPPSYQIANIKSVSGMWKQCDITQLQQYTKIAEKRINSLHGKNDAIGNNDSLLAEMKRTEIESELLLWNSISLAINLSLYKK